MLYRTRMLGIAAAAALSAAVPGSAQIGGPTKVRVVAKTAKIMATTAMASDVIEELTQGTEVDVLLEDAGWYWVVLPRDGHGTRRGGWVRVKDVDGSTEAELAARAAQAEAKREAQAAKKQAAADKRAAAAAERAAKAEQKKASKHVQDDAQAAAQHTGQTEVQSGGGADDKRLIKAQKDLEKARADYEATLKRATPEAELSPKMSKEEARAAKKQAEEQKRAAAAAERAAKEEQKAAAKEAERAIKAEREAAKHAQQPADVDAARTAHVDATSGTGADDKRLQKAQKDLEKARADYEAAVKRRSDASTTPAASPQR
jgi:hypothetical protein